MSEKVNLTDLKIVNLTDVSVSCYNEEILNYIIEPVNEEENSLKFVGIRKVNLPVCCSDCFALDNSDDYRQCRITKTQKDYRFREQEEKMEDCPLFKVDMSPTIRSCLIDRG